MAVVLVCACGKRLKAPGAVPGRLGRCPACGGELRVPEAPETPADPAPPRASAPKVRKRRVPRRDESIAQDRGLLPTPSEVEKTAWEGLAYPLWGAPGLVVLVTMTPVLWLTSLLSIGLVPQYVIGQSEVTAMGALLFIAPMTLFFLLSLGHLGVFYERVLLGAAAGEVHHPRVPGWGLMAMARSGVRLVVCLGCGFAGPAVLAVVYWLHCGDLDWADRLILLAVLTPGAVYAAIALASVVLHDDLWAANPITVVSAMLRLGGGGVALAVQLAFPLTITAAVVPALFALGQTVSGLVTLFACLVFWFAVVYEGMVLARWLGIFCRRENARLGWFSDRPQWG